jgi:hypothetical protein
MNAFIEWDGVAVGDPIPGLRVSLRRVDLVMYSGASGDFNPIHWSDRIALSADLPGVIAHGMLTMAAAGRAVTDWCGDPGALVSFGARFSRPVPVPDDDRGAGLSVTGNVAAKLPNDQVQLDLTVRLEQPNTAWVEVLQRVTAVVQL